MSWDRTRFNPAEDWALFDGSETVSYYPYNPLTDSYGSAFYSAALFREIGRRINPINQGETTVETVMIHVPASTLLTNNHEPQRLDKVKRTLSAADLGSDSILVTVDYIVQQVNKSTMGTRYRLESAKA